MSLLGQLDPMPEDKLARLEAMAEKMDGVSQVMLEAAETAREAADVMLRAAELQAASLDET